MKTLIVALVGIAAAAGAGYYGWKQKLELDRTTAELTSTRAALSKATGELTKAKETLVEVVKELQQQQAANEKLKSDRDTAVAFLMQEKAYGERVRAELALAQQQIAFLRTRGSSAAVPRYEPSLAVPVKPMVIRALPAPQAIGAPMMARPPQ
ncbi:MAG TPA: hypothetical protein VFK84_12095 [Burkholderiales bacterium]|nr:hypothetical protein [Burkholderiales bacterium]